jgi:hypothetical protein
MRRHLALVFLVFVVVAGYAYYHRYVDTLMLSEIVGRTGEPLGDILINLFDFDTGLTRKDLHNLAAKSDYWVARIRQVESIPDPGQKRLENEKLMAEMLQDPSMKKVVRKSLGFGSKVALTILGAASEF